jgi:hypothetical protein
MMPENHDEPQVEIKRINERLGTISNVMMRLVTESDVLNKRRTEILERYREMLR